MTTDHDIRERTSRALDAIARLGIPVARDVPLCDYTTFRIGGPADVLVEARRAEDIAAVVAIARTHEVACRSIGGGSNILASDAGVRGIVIANRIGGTCFDGATVSVGGGVAWDEIVAASVERGLGGMAAMSGIPGSVGGAIYGNAGAYGESVSDRLVSIVAIEPDGASRAIPAADLGFGYRHSGLKASGRIVVDATFALMRDDGTKLREARDEILRTRAAKHPAPSEGTAGSYFKNIEDAAERKRLIDLLELPDNGHRIAAGLLLDRVGARGMRVGDAAVFEKHANIIVNRGHARAIDVIALGDRMRARVREAFAVALKPEVIWLGPPPDAGGDGEAT